MNSTIKRPSHLLIIRLSAIGDVAMAAPVVRQFAGRFPEIRITMVSVPFLQPLFDGLPNLHFVGVNTRTTYRGIKGLWKLFRALRRRQPDVIADIHDVLRTKVIRFLFVLSGRRTYTIDKGRREKRALTRRKRKKLHPLKTSFERYREVLEKCVGQQIPADLPVQIPLYGKGKQEVSRPSIGIAPFAKHAGKIYPIEKMMEVVAHFAQIGGMKVFLFGAGEQERNILENWEAIYPNVISTAGKMHLTEELAVMRELSVMITMDSANMHLASFVGTPVVSVWGATHPYAGFYGWRQSPDNVVRADVSCCPCSVYGNKPCYRGDYLCMRLLEPAAIIKKVEERLA